MTWTTVDNHHRLMNRTPGGLPPAKNEQISKTKYPKHPITSIRSSSSCNLQLTCTRGLPPPPNHQPHHYPPHLTSKGHHSSIFLLLCSQFHATVEIDTGLSTADYSGGWRGGGESDMLHYFITSLTILDSRNRPQGLRGGKSLSSPPSDYYRNRDVTLTHLVGHPTFSDPVEMKGFINELTGPLTE
jgi:hypothetical protein